MAQSEMGTADLPPEPEAADGFVAEVIWSVVAVVSLAVISGIAYWQIRTNYFIWPAWPFLIAPLAIVPFFPRRSIIPVLCISGVLAGVAFLARLALILFTIATYGQSDYARNGGQTPPLGYVIAASVNELVVGMAREWGLMPDGPAVRRVGPRQAQAEAPVIVPAPDAPPQPTRPPGSFPEARFPDTATAARRAEVDQATVRFAQAFLRGTDMTLEHYRTPGHPLAARLAECEARFPPLDASVGMEAVKARQALLSCLSGTSR